MNWSDQRLPQSTDDVLLDNGDLPVSYQVLLPDDPVVLKTIQIKPSPGRNIELVLPSTNTRTDAFSVTGPGYGIALFAGAIFRNASGISAGESLNIADSLIIYNGGRYIHETRASHANSILKVLSSAPGTEEGTFDFDVPRASYTISVSNRTYGNLELHAAAYGSTVSYTCSGANPLLIRGNLRIGSNVHMIMNLSGTNGNIQVLGDFIQEGGQMNLASAGMNNTILRVKGDLYQSPDATIGETAGGSPFLELNGDRLQEVAMAGQMQDQVGMRINNPAGARLQVPLTLPWKLDLLQGVFYNTLPNLLTLAEFSEITVDSSRMRGTYVDGPLRKLGLHPADHFLFPVGKDGNLRWMELKEATGDYTVEFIHENPSSLGAALGSGLDHISKLEYWTLQAGGTGGPPAKIELSFASAQSGGVTDPQYLRVARFESRQWEDAGNTAVTGNFLQGSVLSGFTNLTAGAYTLASNVNLENPLPSSVIDLRIKEIPGALVFQWTVQGPEKASYFDLLEKEGNQSLSLFRQQAVSGQESYQWTDSHSLKKGNHYFRVRMTDLGGKIFEGDIVLYRTGVDKKSIYWIPKMVTGGPGKIMIRSPLPGKWKYEILSVNGQRVKMGVLQLKEETTFLYPELGIIPAGLYIFNARDAHGIGLSLLFNYE